MNETIEHLKKNLIKIISETNGLSLNHTLELLLAQADTTENEKSIITDFLELVHLFQGDKIKIDELLNHPISEVLFFFFKNFPLPYCEEHIHLTGSLHESFIFPYLKNILESDDGDQVLKKVSEVYEKEVSINSEEDVKELIQLKEGEEFSEYLKILYLPKVILRNKEIHTKASYHMAKRLYEEFNVGSIRLKFTLSRSTAIESEKIPGVENVTSEDVVLGLYDGFKKYQQENDQFSFTLTPCFRKELDFYDKENYSSKKEHFESQVKDILELIEKYPFLENVLNEVDTVGDEKGLYRKAHFEEMKDGFRKLQYNGFKIKSHHGETWKVLRKGVQSVDNAMNIWHIDTLEHGISLGINPNYYFHRIIQDTIALNEQENALPKGSVLSNEIEDIQGLPEEIKRKLEKGIKITTIEKDMLIKEKFHHAREIEHYQHDVLNRMINKKVSLVALPSSNLKLTGAFPDYKDHPFSWWERKGVQLGIGTDNYITLQTNFIREMLILLFSESESLKITKLLMIATKEKRRPLISAKLWQMRKKFCR